MELARRSDHFQECVLSRSGYRVRLADSPGQRSKASMLISSMYSWRGYSTQALDITQHDPNRITLEASTGQHIFGTLTLGLDSDAGLLADELYQDKIIGMRQAGRRLCEMTKLAFNPDYSSKEVIASLFHLAHIYAYDIYQCTDLLIEVNPRHSSFYKRRLGFAELGEVRTCRRVHAPAVLLHVGLEYCAEQISRFAGTHDPGEKSLYPYFFSKAEVQGLINRIHRTN